MRGAFVPTSWRYPAIFLCSIGVSSVGSWIYFIALNLIVLDLTKSALAVSGLYIIRAVSTVFTNSWAGSLIDRVNKKYLMMILNFMQALFIAVLPLFPSIPIIYLLVFIITIGSSMYQPTSMAYLTKLLPIDQRKRFNALRSLLDSGAFLTGPAIAGMLFTIGTPNLAIYCNALALLMSAIITFAMPTVDIREEPTKLAKTRFAPVLKTDWQLVVKFSKANAYIMLIYFLFSLTIVLMTATDSLEAAFATQILLLTEGEYGVLVSIAGAGVVVGSLLNTAVVERFSNSWLIGMGSIVTATGYIVFTLSNGFVLAAIGCFVLSFATAFANTGFYTFYQNNIPVKIMGRIGSIYGLVEAFLIIVATVIFGLATELMSIRFVVVLGALCMGVVACVLFVCNVLPAKVHYYLASGERVYERVEK
ncbi:MFS transporter [Sporosarcina saromensis]|uniref:MFS transporter n=1 Tax=Sporosarcina saromensis TaxID=359365 RepID=A0ABU4GAU3_9BACL|nr:MFS transporter [Sporosarcina saromensis]MDW0114095.1 MFS transporter [Sporosarcina saromensis]